jgi:metallo-beta-lactamase family protein
MAKRKGEVEISFVDSVSAEDVTGSSIYIKTPKHNILLDCGMHQSNSKLKDFLINRRKYKGFKPKDIDLVFVRENHADHTCLLPKLIKNGARPRIIVPNKMSNLLRIILEDSANISERDVELINHQNDTSYEPIYTLEDVGTTMRLVEESEINKKIYIDDEISYELIPNAHVYASASLLLYITVNNVTKTLLYTGDIGNTTPKLNSFVGEFITIKKANCVITEATYGDREKLHIGQKERKTDLQKLLTVIDHTIHDLKGKVLIPTFAQSRSQQIAYYLYEAYKDKEIDFDIYIDSPLSIEIFKEYRNVFEEEDKEKIENLMNWEHLIFVKDAEESKVLCDSKEPSVIIASSGFMTHGRARHHAKNLIQDPINSFIFMGYSSEGSLASQIKNNNIKKVNIDQKDYTVRCGVYNLKSFSGHIMCNQLLDYIGSINTEKVIIHHASKSAKENFARLLKQKYEKELKTTKVVCSNSSLRFKIF